MSSSPGRAWCMSSNTITPRRVRHVLLEPPGPPRGPFRALGEPRRELAHEPALPDPRLAQDGEQVGPRAVADAVERVLEQAHLALPSDERDGPARGPGGERLDRPGPDLLTESLGPNHARLAEGDGVAGQLARGVPHQDLVRRGGLLEPGRQVDGGAGHERAIRGRG